MANKLICREIFGDFGFKSKDTKLVRKLILQSIRQIRQYFPPPHNCAIYSSNPDAVRIGITNALE